MTTELTKAAQQALEPCPLTRAIQRINNNPYSLTKDECVEVLRGLREEIRALTQRPAAQSEARALAHNMMLWREDAVHNGNEYVPVHVRTLEKVIAQLRDMPASQQATPAQEPGVFREYFDAHRALIAANGVSERASHAHIVGYRAPSHSTGSEPYAASVARNDQLKRADDAARCARKEAEARFNAALSAAQSATQQATPEPVGEPVAQVSDLFPSVRNKLHAQGFDSDAPLFTRPAPGVPEGFTLVPVEPTPEMMEAMPSMPAIGAPGDMELKAKGWSLKAIQNRHRWLAALAAAQAKGGV